MSASPVGPDTAALAVRMLGGLQVRREGQIVPRPFPYRKAASLFAFLLLHPKAEFSRHVLAGTFWPEVDEEAASRSLSAALVPIRRFLEAGPEDRGRYLVGQHNTLCLIPPPGCWVDIWAFLQAEQEAKEVPAGSPGWFAILERAVALYEGDLLPDHGDDWCTALREEMQRLLLGYFHDLTRADQQRQQYGRACEWARRALMVDRCDEESHRSLMRLHAQQGEYSKAIHQYRECRRALREELDAAPDPETIALHQWLLEQLKRPRPVPSPAEPAFLDLDLMRPLVGRDREQDRLRAAWERARSGRGELILLTGESGIGKTRLGRQLLQEVALGGGLALYGQASALESSFLYRPLLDPLRHALALAGERGLALCSPIWMAQVARLLPEVPLPEGSLAAMGPESPRLLEEGLTQLLLTLASQRPVCLFLDDLQWADAATGRFLHYLAHQSRQARFLLIGAYREGEVPESDWLEPWLIEVEAQRIAASLPLARLNEDEVGRLLEEIARGQASEILLRPLGQRLYEETEGNPLFLLVTLRELFDRGYLVVNEERRWEVASLPLPASDGPFQPGAGRLEAGAAPEGRLPLPVIVQRVVRQRVSRLREEDRQLLQCAAVIGRRFTFPALQRAAGQELAPTLDGVERLLAADLIRAQAHPAAFDFRHDKIREVVYEELMPTRRQALHRRVGEALEAIYGVADDGGIEDHPYPTWSRRPPPPPDRARAEEHAEELARHFHEAAPLIGPEKAVRYYYLAGTRARALCDYEKALSDLLAARSLLAELPPDASSLAQLGQIVEQLGPAYRGAARMEAHRGTSRIEAAHEVYKDYIAHCEEHGYAAGIARGCTLLGQFYIFHPHLARRETSRALYERAIAVCETHGLHDWVIYPQSLLAYALAASGADLERAEALARACLLQPAARQDLFLLQHVYSCLMWIPTKRTDWQALKAVFQASLAVGGPQVYSLMNMLNEIEGTCRRTGAEATFVDLCHEMAEGYARAGLVPPLVQWYLGPTSPRDPASLGGGAAWPAPAASASVGVVGGRPAAQRPAPGAGPRGPGEPVIQEEFEGQSWHPALVWQDATGRSQLDHVTRPGWLGLAPAEGSNLWPDADLNAPRLVATVRGDFIAQTRVELEWDRHVFAGLLVWRDKQHFARLELRCDPPREPAAVHLAACTAGQFKHVGRGHCDRRPMWLRVERVGEEVRGLCSADGERWLTAGSVRLPQGETEQVGLAGIAPDPGARVWFDSFLLWQDGSGERGI